MCVSSSAAQLLTESWGTELLADPSLFRMMVVVALPRGVVDSSLHPLTPRQNPMYTYQDAVVVQNILHHEYKVEVGHYAMAVEQ